MNFLCDVDPLPVGQTSVHWRSCGGSQRRVECINVEAQMDRSLFSVQEGEKVCVNLQFTSIQTFKIIWIQQMKNKTFRLLIIIILSC